MQIIKTEKLKFGWGHLTLAQLPLWKFQAPKYLFFYSGSNANNIGFNGVYPLPRRSLYTKWLCSLINSLCFQTIYIPNEWKI